MQNVLRVLDSYIGGLERQAREGAARIAELTERAETAEARVKEFEAEAPAVPHES